MVAFVLYEKHICLNENKILSCVFFQKFHNFRSFFYIYLFFGCAGSLLLCGRFSPVVASGGYCLAAVRELLAEVASLGVEQGLQGTCSCGPWALGHMLSSYGAQTQLLCGMWGLPGSGIDRMSPALAGRLFTTEPPRKPQFQLFLSVIYQFRGAAV